MEYKTEQREVAYCKRCGRRLRDAESKARGYGPTCLIKVKKEKLNRRKLFKVIDIV